MNDARVLELGNTLASAYCGRLFASTGADVVLVEPPEGGAVRSLGKWSERVDASLSHEYLNAQKRSVVRPGDMLLSEDMIRWADVIISSCDGDPDAVHARHRLIMSVDPSTVHVVTSGYGLTGPYSTWRSTPLLDWASGGYLYITGEPDREPLQGGGPWPSYITGATAAIGAQAALFHAIRTGEGQLVDVGAMEAVASAHQWTMTMVTHTGAVKGRWGARFGEAYHPMSLYECGDGRWILIGAVSREQWENFCITVDAVELLADDDLYAPGVRFERADEIDATAAPWLRSRSSSDAVAALQENRVPASEVHDFAEVLAMEQLAAREFLVDAEYVGSGARMPSRPFALGEVTGPDAAPALGADADSFTAEIESLTARPLPSIDLRFIRAVEFSVAWAGPLTGRFLADLGVDVVKVEHPTSRGLGTASSRPDRDLSGWTWGEFSPARIRAEIFPDSDPGERPWNRMGIWNKMNRGKRSFCLDAKADGGGDALGALIRSADLLVHNYSPRGARSLGIDHDHLLEWNDRIITIAMTGYGQTGPMAAYASYGPILEACAGVAMSTGYPDHYPNQVGVALPDAIGGLHGTFAALAGLWQRDRTRTAVHVDLSQLETMLSVCGESLLLTSLEQRTEPPIGNRSRDHAPQGVYPCAGGSDSWIALTVEDDEQWRALVSEIGADAEAYAEFDLAQRRTDHDQLDQVIRRWTSQHVAADLAERLQRAGVPALPVFTAAEIVGSDHLATRGFMVELDHPDVGPRLFPGTPLHLSATPIQLREAPALGQHNEAILADLGYRPDQIEALRAAGAIADEPPA